MTFALDQLRADKLVIELPQPGMGKTRMMRRLMMPLPVGEDAKPKRRKRRPSTATLIKRAERAGPTVTAIKPDGTLITGKPDATDDRNEWDDDEVTLQ